MSQNIIQIINGRILTSQGWLRGGSLLVEGTKILEVSKSENTPESCNVTIIDAQGGDIVPGAIEMHVHG